MAGTWEPLQFFQQVSYEIKMVFQWHVRQAMVERSQIRKTCHKAVGIIQSRRWRLSLQMTRQGNGEKERLNLKNS